MSFSVRPVPVAAQKSAPPMQIVAPGGDNDRLEDTLEDALIGHPNVEETVVAAGQGKRQGQILHQEDERILLRLGQEEDNANDRYKQVIIEQSHAEPSKEAGNRVITPKEMKEAEKDFRLRNLAVKNTCAKYNLGIYRRATKGSSGAQRRYPPSANYDVLYIDR